MWPFKPKPDPDLIYKQAALESVRVLYELRKLLTRLVRPHRPYGLSLVTVGETHMASDKLIYSTKLAPLVDPTDVVTRRRVVTVDGVDQAPVDVKLGDDFPNFTVPQDSKVKLTFTDIDDGGNVSAPLTFEFDAKDTFAPAAPFDLKLVEEGEEIAADAPAPQAPPTVEP